MQKRSVITLAAFAAMLALLVFTTVVSRGSYAFSGFLFVILALIPFYASFEHRRPAARELIPIAVLSAVAALGRVIFAPLPNVKPTSAVVIVAGLAFGPQAGFMTGATAALASNIFFGQGPFTPWQMFAWGMMGFTAGLFSRRGLGRRLPVILVFGFLWGFLFGWIMDTYQVIAFVYPVSLKSVLLTFAASFYFDLTHAISNIVFLLCITRPWLRLLNRVKLKYGLMDEKP
jgi:energy-coupling factor transport system substrate-specific component